MGNDKMTENTRYWIWLTMGLGYSSPKPKYLASMYDDMKVLYDGGESELRLCGILTEQEISRLLRTPLCNADEVISKAYLLGQNIIDISEPAYPQCLKSIEDPPAVIYVQGNLPDVDNLNTISIIGTRKATVYGVRTAFELGANLSQEGFVVVSGGALGIDCAAHRGVLQADGITICVLGCGIDYDYLRENKAMRQLIAEKGALVSEYPPGTSPTARNFPQRNRIISGLSQGLIVVEAPKASGSMITVGCALSHSRDVFAVMGNVDSPYSEGSNLLIKDGAIPVTSYKDVSEYYLGVSDDDKARLKYDDEVISSVPTKLRASVDSTKTDNKPLPSHNTAVNLSDEESRVYYTIGAQPLHIDTISEKSGLPVYKVLRIISALEMNDLIVNTEGRNYAIK
ncbi:MAG: DNA-processing protein DprA [Clostridia bacterium]|nr:DNA-processing protein DprA [Clostridia bacterium]